LAATSPQVVVILCARKTLDKTGFMYVILVSIVVKLIAVNYSEYAFFAKGRCAPFFSGYF